MSDEMFGIAVHDGGCTVRCHGQLSGERATRLRDEVRFDSVEAMAAQMHEDATLARKLLAH